MKKKVISKAVKPTASNIKSSQFNSAESFFLSRYKSLNNKEIASLYKRADGSTVETKYFNRIKNVLKKFGMLDEYSSQLLPYQTKAIADGLNHITNMSVKQYYDKI